MSEIIPDWPDLKPVKRKPKVVDIFAAQCLGMRLTASIFKTGLMEKMGG